MFSIYNNYSEKIFNKNEKQLYINELKFYETNNHPNLIKKIDNYEKNNKYYIKFEPVNNLDINFNSYFIREICNYLEYLHENNYEYKFLHKKTVFFKNNIIKFTFNADKIYYNKKYFNFYKNNQTKDVYMLGILIYELHYKKCINFNKSILRLQNYNFETSYINRIIEFCIYNNPSISNIKKDNKTIIFSHRLYEISELKDAR